MCHFLIKSNASVLFTIVMVSYAQVSSEIISVVATVLHSNDPRREQKHSDDMALVRIGGRLAAKLSVILLEGRLRDKDYSVWGLVPLII